MTSALTTTAPAAMHASRVCCGGGMRTDPLGANRDVRTPTAACDGRTAGSTRSAVKAQCDARPSRHCSSSAAAAGSRPSRHCSSSAAAAGSRPSRHGGLGVLQFAGPAVGSSASSRR
eukprot:4279592-Prymnesium_polylepis.1